MLWILKRTVSMRRLFWVPKHMFKLMGKKQQFYSRKNCLTGPMKRTDFADRTHWPRNTGQVL